MPLSAPVCATSPTIVIDRLGQRRISSRHAIGDSSCASSTITWPNAQVRSAAARCAVVSRSASSCRSSSRSASIRSVTPRISPPSASSSTSIEREPPAISSTPSAYSRSISRMRSRRAAAARSSSPSSSAASSSSGTSAGVQPPRLAPQQRPLVLGEHRRGGGDPVRVGVQVGEQPLRGEHRPQLVQGGLDLRLLAQLAADLGPVGLVEQVVPAERVGADPFGHLVGERVHDLHVEQRAGQVVRSVGAADPVPGGAHGLRVEASASPARPRSPAARPAPTAGPVRPAASTSAITARPLSAAVSAGSVRWALTPGKRSPLGTQQHAGLGQRRQHLGDVAQEGRVRADQQHAAAGEFRRCV